MNLQEKHKERMISSYKISLRPQSYFGSRKRKTNNYHRHCLQGLKAIEYYHLAQYSACRLYVSYFKQFYSGMVKNSPETKNSIISF